MEKLTVPVVRMSSSVYPDCEQMALFQVNVLTKTRETDLFFQCYLDVFVDECVSLCMTVVRLVGDRLVLQVFISEGGWRTVCADNWRTKHTRLTCQQLGFTL